MVTAGLPLRLARAQLTGRLRDAGCPDPSFDAAWLLRYVTGRDPRLDDTPLSESEAARLEDLARQRAGRIPLQYLAGRWPFLDMELAVGPGVLIPRADTEVVCEAAAARVRDLPAPRVLDLCAGTGALGLGVRSLVPAAHVTLLEKSSEAFAYLQRNCTEQAAARPGPAPVPVQGDIFTWQDTLPAGQLDLIVSNPPYLTGEEMDALQPEVTFEPAMALAAGTDGLDFYRHIAAAYREPLRPGGWLVLEIGWQQEQAVRGLLAAQGWTNIGSGQDYGGNPRAVWAEKS